MSVWTELTGTITLRTGSGCSINKLVHGIYSETICNVRVIKQTESHIEYNVKIQCCLDGWDIEDYMKRIVQCLKGYDQTVRMDISVNTRFIC
jgi:hypothetical protein